jgi:hypothetical protein
VLTFAVTAGRWYNFNVLTSPTNFTCAVRDAGGSLVGSATGGVGFLATSTGNFSIAFSSANTGAWTVVLSDGIDDAPNTASGAPALTLGVTRNARFEYLGDQDWVSVSLTAGTPYVFTVSSSAVTVLGYIYNADGTTQPSGQSGFFTSTRNFTPAVSGTFHVRTQPNGGTGDYTVRVQ